MHQIQLGTTLLGQRAAQHTATVVQHKVHFLSGDGLCSGNEVALVLTVFIVHHNHKFACTDIFYRLLNRIQHIFIISDF